ncbi:hypothetical protein K2173_005132 [Erythroxylum novogranatense]|uniref:SKP1 component POZ domain-containing protein n=1 Tax=Erythroxylum novogranatense TaxID=1862640 RepID=A0AAV8TUD9_9ROSI|nr:hypothetical protein K2173_005132 [Erythroxylum novogranatense]
MASSSSRKIVLKTCDQVEFATSEEVATQSELVKRLILRSKSSDDEGESSSHVIVIPFVKSDTMELVMKYCQKHVDMERELKKWEEEFMKVDEVTLGLLMVAADHMEIKNLSKLTDEAFYRLVRKVMMSDDSPVQGEVGRSIK